MKNTTITVSKESLLFIIITFISLGAIRLEANLLEGIILLLLGALMIVLRLYLKKIELLER